MRILLVLLFVIVSHAPVAAQEYFLSHYSHDSMTVATYQVLESSDNHYIVAGNHTLSKEGFTLAKIDEQGELIWAHRYGDEYTRFTTMTSAANGGLVVCARYYISSPGMPVNQGTYVIRLDENGVPLWTKNIKFIAEAVTLTSSSEILLSSPWQMMKLDVTGNLLWSRGFEVQSTAGASGSATNPKAGIMETSDNGCVTVSYTIGTGIEQTNAMIVKAAADGSFQWGWMLGGNDEDIYNDVIELDDGSYVAAGYSKSYTVGENSILLSKFTPSGYHIWSKIISTPSSFYSAYSVSELEDGSMVIFAGSLFSRKMLVVTVNSFGNVLSAMEVDNFRVTNGLMRSEGDILVAGDISFNAMSIIKMDIEGESGCNVREVSASSFSIAPIRVGMQSVSGYIPQVAQYQLPYTTLSLERELECATFVPVKEDIYHNVCYGDSFVFADGTMEENITANTNHSSFFTGSYGKDSIVAEYILLSSAIDTNYVSVCIHAQYTFRDSTKLTISDNVEHISIIQNTEPLQCDSVWVEIVTISGCDVIPNIITPNNDGINDFFESDEFLVGQWQLTIFNRWGKQVYYSANYQNDFQGLHFSDGAYYYLAKKGQLQYKGWVEIKK